MIADHSPDHEHRRFDNRQPVSTIMMKTITAKHLRSPVCRGPAVWLALIIFAANVSAEDWPMLGRDQTRNAVSPEKGAPVDWDVKTGKNIKWTARLGSMMFRRACGREWIGMDRDEQRKPTRSKTDQSRRRLDVFPRKRRAVPVSAYFSGSREGARSPGVDWQPELTVDRGRSPLVRHHSRRNCLSRHRAACSEARVMPQEVWKWI